MWIVVLPGLNLKWPCHELNEVEQFKNRFSTRIAAVCCRTEYIGGSFFCTFDVIAGF